jgi:hypothetical protein
MIKAIAGPGDAEISTTATMNVGREAMMSMATIRVLLSRGAHEGFRRRPIRPLQLQR